VYVFCDVAAFSMRIDVLLCGVASNQTKSMGSSSNNNNSSNMGWAELRGQGGEIGLGQTS